MGHTLSFMLAHICDEIRTAKQRYLVGQARMLGADKNACDLLDAAICHEFVRDYDGAEA